jgi:hypothetical protein
MSTLIDTLFSQKLKVSHAARSLNSAERQKIGIQAIGGNTPIWGQHRIRIIKHVKNLLFL